MIETHLGMRQTWSPFSWMDGTVMEMEMKAGCGKPTGTWHLSRPGKREEPMSQDCKVVGGSKDVSRPSSSSGPSLEPESNSVSGTQPKRRGQK